MKQFISTLLFSFFTLVLMSQNKVGIGTPSPIRLLHVYDTLGTGFPFMIESRNAANMVMEIQSQATGAAIGIGMYRQGAAKAYSYVNSSNNYALNMGSVDNFTQIGRAHV